MAKTIQQILNDGDGEELLALFAFGSEITVPELVLKFNIWARFFFPQFFASPDAPFHKQIDELNAALYLGELSTFLDIGFRGCAKTTRTKLFLAFVIANDSVHRRRYLKVLSIDGANSKQTVTDIYNLLIDTPVQTLYPEIFQKTEAKREETMSVFTTATGVKLLADTVGSDQRGQIQDESRPDFIWFDDFETRKSLRSPVITKAIWDNMEEARTGLSVKGAALYTSNYLSERGNVHTLVQKESKRNAVLIVPIEENGRPSWPTRYPAEVIAQIKADADDYEGEFLCKPSASRDILFDREALDRMPKRTPLRDIAGLHIFREFNASHRYATGADVAGGVGLDSSTSVTIDFDTVPAQVVSTFASNTVKPDIFADELARHGQKFGECLIAPEKNKFDMCVGRLKQIYPEDRIYLTPRPEDRASQVITTSAAEYGWETNSLTKPKMLFSLAKAVEDGLLDLNDPRLIAELRSYTRNDLMDSEVDPRLTTRHFDLLMACAIAWQMKDSEQLSSQADRNAKYISNQKPYQP